MANGKYVAYYRVSTRKQGASGLGLEAQQESVRSYLSGEGKAYSKQVGEYLEVESGKNRNRAKLVEALGLCRAYNATLIIAKLDRLARNLNFVTNLMESGVEFVAVDMPNASKFTVHIMAAVAEQEADMIADRTKKAMATARMRGTLLGRRDGAIAAFSSLGTTASAEARRSKAAEKAKHLLPVIRTIQKDAQSLRQIAAVLNERGIETPRVNGKKGIGQWSAVQVKRILDYQSTA